jgi:hypothetical protein
MRRFPSASDSSAALAAIQAKTPVVIGHAIVAPCFRASASRKASIVVSFPRPIFFIAASTSSGAGMTNVPSPQRFDFVLSISATLGKSLLSASFSRQVFRFTLTAITSSTLKVANRKSEAMQILKLSSGLFAINYSCRRASIGSSRAARTAG